MIHNSNIHSDIVEKEINQVLLKFKARKLLELINQQENLIDKSSVTDYLPISLNRPIADLALDNLL